MKIFYQMPPKALSIRSALINLIGAIVSATIFAVFEALFTWSVSRYVDLRVSSMIFVGTIVMAVPLSLTGGFWLLSKSYEQWLKNELVRRKTVFFGMGLGAGFGFLASITILILINFRLDILYFLFHMTLVMFISTSLGAFLGWANYEMLKGKQSI